MIDYGKFQFACPSRTGTVWFLEAARLAGFGLATTKTQAHTLFPSKRECGFRVTLVRHPCDWLASYFEAIRQKMLDVDCLVSWGQLDHTSFDGFIRSYLNEMPGAVGRLYAIYKADSYLRIEDMPWAFIELMEMIDVPYERRRRIVSIGKRNASGSLPLWNRRLRELVLEAESKPCCDFDYY